MPGLASACGAKGVPTGATYLYSLSWLVSILVSGTTYWILWKIFPFPIDQEREAIYIDGEAQDGTSIEEKGTKEIPKGLDNVC